MTDLSAYRFSYLIDVRYADLDVLQHVNNAKYFTYMETARLHYAKEVIGWDGHLSELGVIIAQATCQYKLPLIFGDRVRVYLRASRLGGKSFDFTYTLIREGDGAVAAEGSTVQVAYDYIRSVAIPIPAAWRERMAAYEPALAEG